MSAPAVRWCFGLALLLAGCGGAEHPDALEGAPAGGLAPGASQPRVTEPSDLPPIGEGVLHVVTRGSVASFLGSTQVVVEDERGRVVAGIEEDTTELGATEASPLSFSLPARQAYTLRLTSTTQSAKPATCRATVGPVHVEQGAAARVHVFGWDCGDRMGYVPQDAQQDCYWLASWSFVAQTRAALGEVVEVGVAPGENQAQLQYRWSALVPELGRFSDEQSSTTALRCLAAGDQLPFEVSISDGVCQQRVTQAISCQ